MANPYYIEPANPLQALMTGVQGYDKSREYAQQNKMEEGRLRALESLMSGNPDQAVAHLIGSGDTKSAAALAQYQQGANSVYGTPIYGNTPNGPAIGTFDKRGRFRQIDTGNFTVTPGVKTIDTGTGTLLIDSKSGQPVQGQPGVGSAAPAMPPTSTGQVPSSGYIPKDVQGEAQQKKYGSEIGDKQASLGAAKAALDSSISNIDRMSDVAKSIIADPALGRITGIQSVFPNWPGGNAANVQARLENLKSQVGFAVLQAMRDASKTGGALGQVSDFENRQLQNNLAALHNAQDEKQFRRELAKLIQWGEGVKQRLQAAYDQDYRSITIRPTPPGTAAPVATPGVSKTINGKNYIQINGQWYEQ